MGLIENAKTYTGNDLETIFFRPMLSGDSAQELGVRILYNMPVPTTVQLWSRRGDILHTFDAAGWKGGAAAVREQKTIDLHRVKAESGFSAADYFSLVFEQITSRADVNMEDLSGTTLEAAETELFKKAIAESLRVTMWLGDTTRAAGGYSTFDGFYKQAKRCADSADTKSKFKTYTSVTAATVKELLDTLWNNAAQELKDAKREGQLAYFVTSDIYNAYEAYLDEKTTEGAYQDAMNGRAALRYHGIPLVDAGVGGYTDLAGVPAGFAILTDRRNLVLAVNTTDFPGNEIRMWYNPDAMENRQRAVFMAGCEVLDDDMISMAIINKA